MKRRLTMNTMNIMTAAVLSAMLAACASSYKPNVEVPESFRGAASSDAQTPASAASDAELVRWWEQYQDPVLQKLIRTALENNRDIKIAAARVEEYRAQARIGTISRLPQVTANAGAERSQVTTVGTPALPATTPRVRNDFDADLNVSYELDVWGRVRNLSNAARADFFVTQYARDVTRMGLVADVATAYFSLIALDGQLIDAQSELEVREKFLQLTRAKFEHGAASELDVDSATANVEAVRATVPDLQRQIVQQENALQVLLGGAPGAIERPTFTPDQALPVPPEIPTGLPADVIKRRPDVREAEANLFAADARFKSARASLIPAITLTGSLGSQSADLADFFSGAATTWSLGVNAALSLINADVNRYQVRIQRSREEQAALQYEKTVLTALQDVSDALVARRKYAEVFAAREAQVAALREATRRATRRYEVGYSSYFEVISAQQSLLDAELQQIQAYRNVAVSTVQLYKALGGGWQVEDETPVKGGKDPEYVGTAQK